MFSLFGDSKESKAVVVKAPDPDAVSGTMYRVLWRTVISYFEHVEDFEKIAEASPRVLYDYFVGKTHKPMIEDESAEFYRLIEELAKNKIRISAVQNLREEIISIFQSKDDASCMKNKEWMSLILIIEMLAAAGVGYLMINTGLDWIAEANETRNSLASIADEKLAPVCRWFSTKQLIDQCDTYNFNQGCREIDTGLIFSDYHEYCVVANCGDALDLCREIAKGIYNTAKQKFHGEALAGCYAIAGLAFLCVMGFSLDIPYWCQALMQPFNKIVIDENIRRRTQMLLGLSESNLSALSGLEVSKSLTKEIEKCDEWIVKQEASPTGKPGDLSPMMRLKNRLFAPKAVTVEVVADERQAVVKVEATSSPYSPLLHTKSVWKSGDLVLQNSTPARLESEENIAPHG